MNIMKKNWGEQVMKMIVQIFLMGYLVFNACSCAQDKLPQYRPHFHFFPENGWMNDPNGLIYYEGEYHMFYQYYPDSTVWGPMHWGHAISKDLIHWLHMPVALYPDSLGYIFSGSAVADADNTSGLGTKNNPPMVAVFTYHDVKGERAGRNDFQYQGIAYSTDKGRTWVKYKNNPVLKNPGIRDFRDPKVSWNEETKKWIMVLAAGDCVMFYSSPDLINWTFESEFGKESGAHGGVWECPDLFPVRSGSETKWILIVSINPGGPNGGSATQYFTGNFDGHQFVLTRKGSDWIDYGKDNYAGVTWSNVQDGRILFLGWMSNWQYAQNVPTVGWRSAGTFPRELIVIGRDSDYVLSSRPVKELRLLRTDSVKITDLKVEKLVDVSKNIKGKISPSEISVTFELPNDTSLYPKDFGLILKNSLNEELKIGYDVEKGHLYLDRNNSGKTDFSKDFAVPIKAPCPLPYRELTMEILVDEASVELFAQDGRTVMTNIYFNSKEYDKFMIYTDENPIVLKELRFFRLKSIW